MREIEVRPHVVAGYEIKTESGRWARAVTVGGETYRSFTVAGEALGMTGGAISSAILRGGDLAGKEVRLATGEEVDKLVLSLRSVRNNGHKKRRRKAVSQTDLFDKMPEATKTPLPFEGHVWSDGSVTVRMTSGDWCEFYDSKTSVPDPIDAACRWS